MHSANIKLGTKVRRRNDIGLDTPGAVVRIDRDKTLIYWPDYNFYEVVPVAELEVYGAIPELVAA